MMTESSISDDVDGRGDYDGDGDDEDGDIDGSDPVSRDSRFAYMGPGPGLVLACGEKAKPCSEISASQKSMLNAPAPSLFLL